MFIASLYINIGPLSCQVKFILIIKSRYNHGDKKSQFHFASYVFTIARTINIFKPPKFLTNKVHMSKTLYIKQRQGYIRSVISKGVR